MSAVRGYKSEKLVSIDHFPLRTSRAHQSYPIGTPNCGLSERRMI